MSETFLYDVVDYPPYVHEQMHPSRLAAIARLHGIPAATPRRCRLLEVGCGDGLQLLTLSQAYPDSQFIGVDLSTKAIARGEAMRRSLGLDNLQLVAADLLDWDAGTEPCDYILAHGFWSWVPPAVRQRLLALCEQNLAPAGIAYVSYNTLPGCHLRRMLWDIMKFHSDGAATPAERVDKAMECLDLLENGMVDQRRYSKVMASEIKDLRQRLHPSVLLHDDLSPINDPCTLSEFLQQAHGHGLAFLAEANYLEMSLKTVTESVRPILAGIAEHDLATKEQYLDFITGRRFRQTMLCRVQAMPSTQPDVRVLPSLEAVCILDADSDAPDEKGVMQFSRLDSRISTDNPLLQHLLLACQAKRPLPHAVRALVYEARDAIASTRSLEEDTATAVNFLLGAFQVGMVELHCDAPRFALKAGERPCMSPLARLQIGEGHARFASLVPSMGKLESPLARELALLLDGNRDHETLRHDWAARMATIPTQTGEGSPLACRPQAWWQAALPDLEEGLDEMARLGLLLS
ncbi:MAG: class I SAM-dependent methyltransferase [Thermomonas sp.]|uniref:methyltransferase regulatory domain-containing protein n=1 Tax=Thermomonas sp. TaxID=1971895 RepID=UPI0039E2E5C2